MSHPKSQIRKMHREEEDYDKTNRDRQTKARTSK